MQFLIDERSIPAAQVLRLLANVIEAGNGTLAIRRTVDGESHTVMVPDAFVRMNLANGGAKIVYSVQSHTKDVFIYLDETVEWIEAYG